MSNVSAYRFEDFTRKKYAQLIRSASRKFVFRSYGDFGSSEQDALWRHDLDFSVHAGLTMARMEARAGLKSTYFFLLSSEFYNLFEKSVRAAAKEIIALGHDAGLHFDPRDHEIGNEGHLVKGLKRDRALLQELLGSPVHSFSFHYPRTEIGDFSKLRYAGMINAYAPKFTQGVKYCSDSNGYWRYDSLFEVVRDATGPIHALTHPEWWSPAVMSPRERILRCATGRAAAQIRFYDRLIREAGRKNIGSSATISNKTF